VSQLKPNQIILHCGLHKTGSTYIQRNLQANHELLLKHGVLYLGPGIFKERCSKLWHHLESGQCDLKTPTELILQTRTSLLELAGKHPEKIHTILLSNEAFFGTLRRGLTKANRKKLPNTENKIGLYRYAKSRIRRLIIGLEDSLEQHSLAWTLLVIRRDPEAFVRSCHTQLLKEGVFTPETRNFETFIQTADFSYTNHTLLKQALSQLRNKHDVHFSSINYDELIDPNQPSTYLWNFLGHALPQQADKLRQQIENNTAKRNLNKTTNPGLSKRGVELAILIRPFFKHSEWKLFRKFLEKNFAKNSHANQPINSPWNSLKHALQQRYNRLSEWIEANTDRPKPDIISTMCLSERGVELADQALSFFKRNERKLFLKFLKANFAQNRN